METEVYQIDLKDGRKFRIFCANATQKRKFIYSLQKIKDKIRDWGTITNGLHTHKQWEEITKNI